jgi:transmembrane sensor
MNRQILHEASAWFVDFRVGDTDSAARVRFDEWLRTSPEHVRAYMQIAKTYVDLPSMTNRKVDPEILIALARSQVDEETNVVPLVHSDRSSQAPTSNVQRSPASARMSVSRRRLLYAIAAVACVVTTLLTWVAIQQQGIYATDIGERRSVTLSDGSTIDLNARSKIRVRFTRAERGVELIDGQALFQVTQDKSRSFIVQSGATQVRAVGTQFDVYRKASSTTVTVLEGRVSVLQQNGPPSAVLPSTSAPLPSGPTMVKAGEQLTISTDKRMTAPRQADVAATTAWTQRRLVFDGSRLGDVVEDFNRYNRRPLIVEDPELQEFHISGVYSSTDPTSLVRFLRAQPGIQIIETDESIRIARANWQ